MRHANRLTMLTVALGLMVGCQTTQEAAAPQLTPEQVAALQAKWTGTWSGAWGQDGGCGSSIEISEVQAGEARAEYTWKSGCGSPPGTMVDSNARILGNTIKLSLTFGTTVQYTMRDDGHLNGRWESRRRGASAAAVFYRE